MVCTVQAVADWLNRKALAVDRVGPPILTPLSGVPSCREAAPLIQLGDLGERYKLPQWGLGLRSSRQRFLRILSCNPAFLEVTF